MDVVNVTPRLPAGFKDPYAGIISKVKGLKMWLRRSNEQKKPSTTTNTNGTNNSVSVFSAQPHHAALDAVRLLEDALVVTYQAFIPGSEKQKPTSTDYSDARQFIVDALRDAEILTPCQFARVVQFRQLGGWLLTSASRSYSRQSIEEMVDWLDGLLSRWSTNFERVISGKCVAECRVDGHASCRAIALESQVVHLNLPGEWKAQDLLESTTPLPDTAPLTLRTYKEVEAEERERREEEEAIRREQEGGRESEWSESGADGREEEKTEDAPVEVSDKEKAALAKKAARRSLEFSLRCIRCHHTLLRHDQVGLVHNNRVYSKITNAEMAPEDEQFFCSDPDGLDINKGDTWVRPRGATLGQEHVQVTRSLQSGEWLYREQMEQEDAEELGEDEDLGPDGEGSLGENTYGAHCNSCHAYIGRYFEDLGVYRLVYIDRASGQNWMYFTGDAGPDYLPVLPSYAQYEAEQKRLEAEEQGYDDEYDDESGSKKPKEEEPVPGPKPADRFAYVGERWSQVVWNAPLRSVRFLSKRIVSTMRSSPDHYYDLPQGSSDARGGIELALSWDQQFRDRRNVDSIITQVARLMVDFPTAGYENTTNPPVPLYTHFFLKNPDFTQARGTARYVFHYLTGKNDAELKRIDYSIPRLLRALHRSENQCVHLTLGGHGGHRLVLVRVGQSYRIIQSNSGLADDYNRFTCLKWIRASHYPWARTLTKNDLMHFLLLVELARKGDTTAWQELFCFKHKVLPVSVRMDKWKSDDVRFVARPIRPQILRDFV